MLAKLDEKLIELMNSASQYFSPYNNNLGLGEVALIAVLTK